MLGCTKGSTQLEYRLDWARYVGATFQDNVHMVCLQVLPSFGDVLNVNTSEDKTHSHRPKFQHAVPKQAHVRESSKLLKQRGFVSKQKQGGFPPA